MFCSPPSTNTGTFLPDDVSVVSVFVVSFDVARSSPSGFYPSIAPTVVFSSFLVSVDV
jgi:hypothetical protein